MLSQEKLKEEIQQKQHELEKYKTNLLKLDMFSENNLKAAMQCKSYINTLKLFDKSTWVELRKNVSEDITDDDIMLGRIAYACGLILTALELEKVNSEVYGIAKALVKITDEFDLKEVMKNYLGKTI